MIERAARYIEYLNGLGNRAVVSAPVVSEYLVGLSDPEERKNHLATLNRDFVTPPFDIRAATIAADIWRNTPVIEAIRQQPGITRHCLKADTMIIACAIACGSEKLITEDVAHMQPLAQGMIIVSPIPENLDMATPSSGTHQQSSLFGGDLPESEQNRP